MHRKNLQIDDGPGCDDTDIVFFKITDSSKAFSALTVLGDATSLVGVDLLVQTYNTHTIQWEPKAKATVFPSGSILSVT